MSLRHHVAARQGVADVSESFADVCGGVVRAVSIETVQVNIGLKCNLACRHCHVESSPKRTESMSWSTMQAVLAAARQAGARTLDITGGAPEMHSRFRDFVLAARGDGMHVIVRTNLTVMLLEELRGLPAWLAERQVHLIASLPCYLPTNVDRQRGRHVHRDSIAVLQKLNALGYGRAASLQLDLIYNPLGAQLPPDQAALEEAYRRELKEQFGIEFHHLLALANLPLGRFLDDLKRQGRAVEYESLLRRSFNRQTVDHLMCRRQLHVGWDGALYDCDFNFALGLPAEGNLRIDQFDADSFRTRAIATAGHCFGCTAGSGSSCGGSLVSSSLS